MMHSFVYDERVDVIMIPSVVTGDLIAGSPDDDCCVP